ncbi:hypothetical protein EW145_g4384 [Phellinidium pouzarii]|uniref:DASH complex subunit DAM1 n=1 Tax=Phellinidium pouzarii TaxID=167371 RepID=A0A4S4L467_9AGAM|nr:hypothetical protein EW145_g4384 [Phellinidium pouzarii]
MAPPPHQQRTPLRRLSQGSLRALSRSGTFPDAPVGLGFLEPAMEELADEAETLHGNLAGLHALSGSLQAFNESFASYLYVMEMNALTTDWPQAPMDVSYDLARKRAEDDARTAQAALLAAAEAAAVAEKTAAEEAQAEANETTIGNASSSHTQGPGSKIPIGILKNTSSGLPKKKGKPKMNPKERRERSLMIEKVVSNLPLEFRGQDPVSAVHYSQNAYYSKLARTLTSIIQNLRRNVEYVIELMMDNPNGLESALQDKEFERVAIDELFYLIVLNFVKPPELNQARANKCLLALINRKIVSKDNSSGRILYLWNGVPN